MQLATIIYNSRINDYRRMRHLSKQLDDSPTPEAVAELAEVRIHQLNAFRELKSFNLSGRWLGLHPLVTRYSELTRLRELRRSNPSEFLAEHARTQRNVQRYKRAIKDDRRSDRRGRDEELLAEHEARAAVFAELIE